MNARRISRDDGWGRSTRFYEVPGGMAYPSVTSILKCIAKPALIGWAAKQERELALRAAADLFEDLPLPTPASPRMSRTAYLETLTRRMGATKAHARALAKAADIGSQAHAMIEWRLRRELGQEAGPEPHGVEAAEWAVMAWEDWRKTANLSLLRVEETVYSERHAYAGTLDLYCEIDTPEGRGRAIVDWKSGKGIYPEAHLQLAAYAEALIEMDHAERPLHGLIVRVPKVESETACATLFVPQRELTERFKVFLHAIELFKWWDAADNG